MEIRLRIWGPGQPDFVVVSGHTLASLPVAGGLDLDGL